MLQTIWHSYSFIQQVTVWDSVAALAHSIPHPTDVAKMEYFIRGLDKQNQSSDMSAWARWLSRLSSCLAITESHREQRLQRLDLWLHRPPRLHYCLNITGPGWPKSAQAAGRFSCFEQNSPTTLWASFAVSPGDWTPYCWRQCPSSFDQTWWKNTGEEGWSQKNKYYLHRGIEMVGGRWRFAWKNRRERDWSLILASNTETWFMRIKISTDFASVSSFTLNSALPCSLLTQSLFPWL